MPETVEFFFPPFEWVFDLFSSTPLICISWYVHFDKFFTGVEELQATFHDGSFLTWMPFLLTFRIHSFASSNFFGEVTNSTSVECFLLDPPKWTRKTSAWESVNLTGKWALNFFLCVKLFSPQQIPPYIYIYIYA